MNSSPPTPIVDIIEPYNGWTPVKHHVLKDEELKDRLHDIGYAIIDFISEEKVTSLLNFYAQEHDLSSEKGGMFYSVYSRDIQYRRRVHDRIGKLIRPEIDGLFTGYKNVLNSFVVKASGPNSAFYLHQDTTALDEFKYSGLSIWIALQDVGPENGCLHIIPRSHWILSPYRGVTIPFPFKNIQETVRPYLQPMSLKAGQALIFDPRLIHDSSVNLSGNDRLAIVSGIFPEDAEFITCYKDQSDSSNPIEFHKHRDNYLIEYDKFFYDCHDRPANSEIIGTVPDDFPIVSKEQFIRFCKEAGIEANISAVGADNLVRDFISEPVLNTESESKEVRKNWFKSLFS